MIRRIFLFHQCSNNSLRKKDIEDVKIISIYFYLGIEAFQVSVGLSCPYKHNRLATDVSHGYGRPDFVVDGVKLSENDPIYSVRIVAGGMIGEGGIELNKLINGLVANKSLTNKKNQVRGVH